MYSKGTEEFLVAVFFFIFLFSPKGDGTKDKWILRVGWQLLEEQRGDCHHWFHKNGFFPGSISDGWMYTDNNIFFFFPKELHATVF